MAYGNNILNKAQKASQNKFYSQESFEGCPKIRRAACFILLFAHIAHFVLSLTVPSSLGSNPEDTCFLNYFLPSLATVLCLLSHSNWLAKENNLKFTKLRIILSFGAALAFTSYIVIFQPDMKAPLTEDYTNPFQGRGDWVRANTTMNEPFYIILIFSLVSPYFLFKAMVATVYYAGICSHLSRDHPAVIWLIARNVVSWLFTISLLGLHSGFRWELFVKSLELEEWNKVYREILDRNPSCISVFSKEGMVYSNTGFEQLTKNKAETFFQEVTNLKRRDFLNINHQSVSGPLTPIHSEESLFRTQGFVNKKTFPRMSTKTTQRMSTKGNKNVVYSFPNLLQLLDHYRDLLAKEQLPKEDQIIFDGKFMGKLDSGRAKDRDHGLIREGRRSSVYPAISYEVIIKPFTEYKKLILILNNTTERDLIVGLENNSEYKDKVLASVSHELRTPLNGNLGCIQAGLNDRSVPEFVKARFLAPAFNSGKLLLHFIEGILDYSLMQADGIRLRPEPKSLVDTLIYCYGLFEQSIKAKGLELKMKWSEDLPEYFNTDHERLKQIVINLLSNAIKFTTKGGITLSACPLKGSRVEIKVEDTGLGMKQESIGRLFEERIMVNGLGSKGNHSKGVGLGLKISQRLAELLGDSDEEGIQVTSTCGQGSTFMFIIKDMSEYTNSLNSEVTFERGHDQGLEQPKISIEGMVGSVTSQGDIVPHEYLKVEESNVATTELSQNYFKIKRPVNHLNLSTNESKLIPSRNDPKQIASRNDSPERTTICYSPREHKVLIVDDDPLNILVLETFVIQCGIQNDTAFNGKEALDKIIKNPEAYKLILMDCQMPVMDGFETTTELVRMMKQGNLPVIPIIGCTAFVGQDKLDECIKVGMREVLPKPVIKNKIVDVLRKYLGINSVGLNTKK